MEIVDNGNKKVLISGTGNRYQINKLKKEPVTIKKKKEVERWGIPIEYFEEDVQFDILNDLFCYLRSDSKLLIGLGLENNYKLGLTDEQYKIIVAQINKKIYSYKQQDIIKKRLETEKLIGLEEVLTILKSNQLCCYYCKKRVNLLYDVVREMNQWTLDRINNDLGHNSGNCVLSCLSCNLKRRRTGADAFLFTKQLNIVKKDNNDNNAV
jgi:hypothetical protein